MNRIMQRGMAAVVFVLSCGATAESDDLDLSELLAVVNDDTIPCEDRAAAERALIESAYVSILPEVFSSLADPVGQREISIKAAVAGTPSTTIPESDCRSLPVPSQIAHARLRIWYELARNAEPEEERTRIFVALFDDSETDRQFQQLMSMSIHNHSEALEEKLWSLFADRNNDANTRGRSMATLVSVTGVHARANLIRRHRPKIIEYAWEERGSDVATNVGGFFGSTRTQDPYLNALKLDWYDRQRNARDSHSNRSMIDVLDRMEFHFGNISGVYKQRRGTTSDKAVDIARQRMALRREARETGDDTKLREFEAEVAAQQQAELELRIERIDAWIERNRDRLEREAEEYAEERRREREQKEQGSPAP